MAFEIDPAKAAYDFDHGRVNFFATNDGAPVPCAISEEALMDNFGASGIEPVDLVSTFRTHAFSIAAIAERKFRAGLFEHDGYILVRTTDR